MNPIAHHYRFNKSAAMSIDWYVGKRCNFDCSYCVDYLHDLISPHIPYEKMVALVDIIYEKYGTNVLWSLTGGEPTVHPKFLEICDYIKNQKGARFVALTTNGSRTTDYHLELFDSLDSITMSLHFEFMSHRIEEYIEKCIKINDWVTAWNKKQEENEDFPSYNVGYTYKSFICRFMVEPSSSDHIRYMEKHFKEAGITNIEYRNIIPPMGNTSTYMPDKKLDLSLDYHKKDKEEILEEDIPNQKSVVEDYDQYYSEKEKFLLREKFASMPDKKKKLSVWMKHADGEIEETYRHYNEVTFEKLNNFKNWYCWAGIKHLKIVASGDVYIGSCHVGGIRGNIYSPETLDLPTDPVVCPLEFCHDNLDLKVPKIKDMQYYNIVKTAVEGNEKN